MAQNASTSSTTRSSALDREANHVDKLVNGDRNKQAEKETREGGGGLNNPTRVKQDSRVEKAKADAKDAGGGPDKPEDGLNQDG